jgi:hypothetical protein
VIWIGKASLYSEHSFRPAVSCFDLLKGVHKDRDNISSTLRGVSLAKTAQRRKRYLSWTLPSSRQFVCSGDAFVFVGTPASTVKCSREKVCFAHDTALKSPYRYCESGESSQLSTKVTLRLVCCGKYKASLNFFYNEALHFNLIASICTVVSTASTFSS